MPGEKRVTAAGLAPLRGVAVGAVITLAVVAGLLAVLLTDRTGERGSGLGDAYTYDYSEHREIDPKLLTYSETGSIRTGFGASRGIAVGTTGPGGPGIEETVYVAGDRGVRGFALGTSDGGLRTEFALDGEPRCLAIAVAGAGKGGFIHVGMADHIEVFSLLGSGGAERKAVWPSLGPKALVTSVAVSAEHVFVADAGNRVVHRLDLAGKVTGRIGEKDEARGVPGIVVYKPCLDVLVAPVALGHGKLVVVNPGRHRVETYTFDGELLSSWGKASVRTDGFSGCCNPANIAMLPDGRTVTAEKGLRLRRVKVYDSEGKLEAVVAGPKQFEDAGLALDLAVDSKGRILVLDPAAGAVRLFEER